MATYICEIWNSWAGGLVDTAVEADTMKQALLLLDDRSRKRCRYIRQDSLEIKTIPDDEHLLFELDASNSDEITVKEGFGQETTYTRKEVEASVFRHQSCKRFSVRKLLESDEGGE